MLAGAGRAAAAPPRPAPQPEQRISAAPPRASVPGGVTLSRIPRFQEHLKTGFTAEAVSAARFRAYAAKADDDGLPNLAQHWRRLAAEKDGLAVELLAAARQSRGEGTDIADAIANERYENEVLYPKMQREVDEGTRQILVSVIERQKDHLSHLEDLRLRFMAAKGDVDLPSSVDQGVHD
jgi:rubrerythrin